MPTLNINISFLRKLYAFEADLNRSEIVMVLKHIFLQETLFLSDITSKEILSNLNFNVLIEDGRIYSNM